MRWAVGVVVAAAAAHGWPAAAAETTAAAILARSADLDCLEYRPVGLCVWMTCSIAGCDAATSVKYRHFVPEAVVTAYGAREAHPWVELAAVVENAEWARGGTFARLVRERGSSGLRFKMSEVVGSPGLAWVSALADSGLTVCDAHGAAMRGYYASGADPMWRLPMAQVAGTVRFGTRRVKEPGWSGALWGPVWPRIGWVQQANDYKAAAVVAQRAADIVTRRRQWHVYRHLGGRDRPGNWGPEAVREGEGNHKWQRLVPEGGSCEVFGAERTGLVEDRSARAQTVAGAYAWNLWRPYECCRRRGQFLVAHW